MKAVKNISAPWGYTIHEGVDLDRPLGAQKMTGPSQISGNFFILSARAELFQGTNFIFRWADSEAKLRYVEAGEGAKTLITPGGECVVYAELPLETISTNSVLAAFPWLQGAQLGIERISAAQYDPRMPYVYAFEVTEDTGGPPVYYGNPPT